jgi:6-phospho-3-hexuloisomerase
MTSHQPALALLATELHAAADATAARNEAGIEEALTLLADAPRVFVHGAGRSGLALRMTAMRFMHLGLAAHVVGEATTPAIAAGDVLLVATGSGTTGGIVRAVETAVEVGARVIAITTAPDSPVGRAAAVVLVVPAPEKQDHAGLASVQYAGGLFEQTVVLLGDALFHTLWQRSGVPAEELWPRHANIE